MMGDYPSSGLVAARLNEGWAKTPGERTGKTPRKAGFVVWILRWRLTPPVAACCFNHYPCVTSRR